MLSWGGPRAFEFEFETFWAPVAFGKASNQISTSYSTSIVTLIAIKPTSIIPFTLLFLISMNTSPFVNLNSPSKPPCTFAQRSPCLVPFEPTSTKNYP